MNQTRRPASAKEEVVDERLQRYRDRRDKVDEIDIVHVFEALDGEPNQDGNPAKWKVDGYNIIHRGQGWLNVSTDIHKGFGGVSLVQHIKGFQRQGEAVEWLEKLFGESIAKGELKADPSAVERRTKANFEPPDRLDDLLPAVEGYLTSQRGLPPSLVKAQVASGNLYASRRWDEKNNRYSGAPRCVFMGSASAELREIEAGGFNGCCTGSQTDVSGFRVPFARSVSENILAMQEAAIDALSYRSLFPGRYTFSTNGAGRFNLQYKLALQATESGVGVRVALDADFAGDRAAQRVFNALYLRNRLSTHLGVEPEQIDAWMTSEAMAVASGESDASEEIEENFDQRAALATLPGNSPHELFFNIGWKAELEEHAAELVDVPGKAKPDRVWKATGRMAPPSIRLMVTRDVHPRMPRGEHLIKVSEADYKVITEQMNVRRDRTPWGKDWNDALRKLGSAYSLAYEKAAKTDFAGGPPPLPYELEVIRTPGLQRPVATPSASAPAVMAAATTPGSTAQPKPAQEGGRTRPVSFQGRSR